MKKVLLFICCILIIFTMTACKVHPITTRIKQGDYQKNIDMSSESDWFRSKIEELNNTLPSEYLTDAKAAAERAETVWFDIYGEEEIKKQQPYRVSFDEQNSIWVVEGTLRLWPFPAWLIPMAGGTAYIVMQQEDGKILAYGHGK